MIGNYKDNADVFKALGDENRLKILELLRQGEKCGNELLDAIKISQSTLSHHMKIMCVSGIIKSRKKGTWTYYSINTDGAAAAGKLLAEITLPDGYKADEKSEEKAIEKAETEKPKKAEKSEKKAEVKKAEDKITAENNQEPAHKQSGARPNGWLL